MYIRALPFWGVGYRHELQSAPVIVSNVLRWPERPALTRQKSCLQHLDRTAAPRFSLSEQSTVPALLLR